MIGITVYFNSGNFPAVQTKATIYFGLGLILKMINIIWECKHLIWHAAAGVCDCIEHD